MNKIFNRGEIYYIDLSPVKGSEQGGLRPCVIVQNNSGNRYAPTLIVVPLTTKTKRQLPTHATVREGTKESTALCEQIKTIDKSRVSGNAIGRCSPRTMTQIDLCLKISLGL